MRGVYRRWVRWRCDGVMEQFVAADLLPTNRAYTTYPYIALDIETTGLDAKRDEIISIGTVRIDDGAVCLGTGRHWLVRPSHPDFTVGNSVEYHGITDGMLEGAPPLEQVIPELLDEMQDRILVVHYAGIDVDFLHVALKRLYGVRLSTLVVDTMVLGARPYHRQNIPLPENALRLDQLRAQYNLPRYKAHHALYDAIGTAELFLAMAAKQLQDHPVLLRHLLL